MVFLWMHFLQYNLIIALLFGCVIAVPWLTKSMVFLERCQRIIHNHEFLNFEELLNKNNSVSNHHKNMRALVIQI